MASPQLDDRVSRPKAIAPHDVTSERLVIGSLLQDARAARQALDRLRPQDFFLDLHRRTFELAGAVDRQGLPVNLESVYREGVVWGWQEDISFTELTRIVDEVPTAAHVAPSIETVLDLSAKRSFVAFFEQVIRRIQLNGERADTLRSSLRRDLEDLGLFIGPPALSTGRLSSPLSALLGEPDEPVCFLVERLVVAGANGWIAGEPKVLKSWLALYLALCLAAGVPVFGCYGVPVPVRVLYLQEEDGWRRVRRRIRQLLTAMGIEVLPDERFRYSIKAGILLDDDKWLEAVREELAVYRPAIVIADVFELMHSKDSDRRAELKPVLYRFDRLREEFACGFLLVDHFKKSTVGGSRRGGQRLAGTVGKHAWGECSLYLFPGQGKNQVRVETELKDGPSETFGLVLEDTQDGGVSFRWEPEATDRATEMKAKILDVVEGLPSPDGWVTSKQVAEAAGVSGNTASKWLTALADEDGKLERERRQVGKVKPWHWHLKAQRS